MTEPYPFPECPILSQVIEDLEWDPWIEMEWLTTPKVHATEHEKPSEQSVFKRWLEKRRMPHRDIRKDEANLFKEWLERTVKAI
jgi:hypothetical protein